MKFKISKSAKSTMLAVLVVITVVSFFLAFIYALSQAESPGSEISQTNYNILAGYTEDMIEEGNQKYIDLLNKCMDDEMITNDEYKQLKENQYNWDKRSALREVMSK